MKLLLKAKYIIFAVVFIIFLFVGTKYGWLVQRYTFSKALAHALEPGPELTHDLSRCLRTCSEKDRGFAGRLLEIVSTSEGSELPLNEHSSKEQSGEIKNVLFEATKNYIDISEVKSAVEMYLVSLKTFQGPDLEDVYKGIDELVVQFPRNGHVYEVLGIARQQKNPRDEKAIAAFKKCLSILPTELLCQNGYASTVRAFTEPYCAAGNINPLLQLRSGFEPQWVVTSAEIAEVIPLSVKDATASAVLVRFTAEGLKRLQEIPIGANPAQVELRLEENVVGMLELPREHLKESMLFQASSQGKEPKSLFENICAKPTTNPLPKSLKI